MGKIRTAVAATVLVAEAGLGVLGVSVHYGVTAEYGDVTNSFWTEFLGGFSTGVSGLALVVLLVAALIAASLAPKVWMRLAAIAIPVLMVVSMLAVTPAALDKKLEQYAATPQCVFAEDKGTGPGYRAARESQEAFNSIEHVGLFGGGGASGVGGCDRRATLVDDIDALGHYRQALPDAGWRIVESNDSRLRAERDNMAFEVVACDPEVVVWAGRDKDPNGARCDDAEQVGPGA